MAMLRYLHPENAMLLFYLVLMEHKVLIHSLRPALMTSIAEAITTVSSSCSGSRNVMGKGHWGRRKCRKRESRGWRIKRGEGRKKGETAREGRTGEEGAGNG